jgi:hypothetical protein
MAHSTLHYRKSNSEFFKFLIFSFVFSSCNIPLCGDLHLSFSVQNMLRAIGKVTRERYKQRSRKNSTVPYPFNP